MNRQVATHIRHMFRGVLTTKYLSMPSQGSSSIRESSDLLRSDSNVVTIEGNFESLIRELDADPLKTIIGTLP